jgi:hypothetical protein
MFVCRSLGILDANETLSLSLQYYLFLTDHILFQAYSCSVELFLIRSISLVIVILKLSSMCVYDDFVFHAQY